METQSNNVLQTNLSKNVAFLFQLSLNKKKEYYLKIMKLIQGCHLRDTIDLAKLYQCANGAKSLNIALKRHLKRFSEKFMFQITKEEYNDYS